MAPVAVGKKAGVAIVDKPNSEGDEQAVPAHQVCYFAGFYEPGELARQLQRESGAVGLVDADGQIALSDGGSGLGDVLQRLVPRCVCILGFAHAKEHLVELAQALHATNDEARKRWLDRWCHPLETRRRPSRFGEPGTPGLERMQRSGRRVPPRATHVLSQSLPPDGRSP
jgi:hypothetical protein